MQIENSAMAAWFDKSGVYFSVDAGVGNPQLNCIQWWGTNKYHKRSERTNEGLYNEQEQTLNIYKQ